MRSLRLFTTATTLLLAGQLSAQTPESSKSVSIPTISIPIPVEVQPTWKPTENNIDDRVASLRRIADTHGDTPAYVEEVLLTALRKDPSERVREVAASLFLKGNWHSNKTIVGLSHCVAASDKDGYAREQSVRVRAVASHALDRALSQKDSPSETKESVLPTKPFGDPEFPKFYYSAVGKLDRTMIRDFGIRALQIGTKIGYGQWSQTATKTTPTMTPPAAPTLAAATSPIVVPTPPPTEKSDAAAAEKIETRATTIAELAASKKQGVMSTASRQSVKSEPQPQSKVTVPAPKPTLIPKPRETVVAVIDTKPTPNVVTPIPSTKKPNNASDLVVPLVTLPSASNTQRVAETSTIRVPSIPDNQVLMPVAITPTLPTPIIPKVEASVPPPVKVVVAPRKPEPAFLPMAMPQVPFAEPVVVVPENIVEPPTRVAMTAPQQVAAVQVPVERLTPPPVVVAPVEPAAAPRRLPPEPTPIGRFFR